MMNITETEKMKDFSNMETQNRRNKPSCPKEFFAKLYGHLEDRKTEDSVDNQESDVEISQVKFQCDEIGAKEPEVTGVGCDMTDKDILQPFPAPFPFIPAVVPRNGAFCPDTAFTAGFTAFCKLFE